MIITARLPDFDVASGPAFIFDAHRRDVALNISAGARHHALSIYRAAILVDGRAARQHFTFALIPMHSRQLAHRVERYERDLRHWAITLPRYRVDSAKSPPVD